MNLGTLKVVPITDVVMDAKNRAREGYGVLAELADSISKNGLIQPIAVYSPTGEPPYKLMAGGRRYMAVNILKWEEISCRIYDYEMTQLELDAVELYENLHRLDLTHMEQAKLTERLHLTLEAIHGKKVTKNPEDQGSSYRATAQALGRSHTSVIQDINLAEADRLFPELELGKKKNRAAALKDLQRLKTVVNNKMTIREARKDAVLSGRMLAPDDPLSAYIVGDFFANTLAPGQFQFIECDPPYGIDLQEQRLGGQDDPSLQHDYKEIAGPEYLAFMNKLVDACYELAAESSYIIIWCGPQHLHRVVMAMERKFKIVNIPGIWVKGETAGQAQGMDTNLGNAYEMFVYGRKGAPQIRKRGRSNVFNFNGVPGTQRIHPTERPASLMRELIETFVMPDSQILVPFAGSGVTLTTAFELGHKCVGFDLSQHFHEAYVARLLKGEGK